MCRACASKKIPQPKQKHPKTFNNDCGEHMKRTSIRRLILSAATLVSVVLFVGAYTVISSIYDRTVREDASNVSGIIADQTFNSMYQIMSKGWTRQELEQFIDATRTTFRQTPYSLNVYRGSRVEQLFGKINQPPLDGAHKQVLKSGEKLAIQSENGIRHVFPLKAQDKCLRCHINAHKGDVLGLIDVKQDLTPVIEKARSNFMWALSIIAPIPFAVAFLVAFYLNRKINSSINTLEDDIKKVNTVSDLSQIQLKNHDLGLEEVQSLFSQVDNLVGKLREFAVDKHLLEFEIRLLEKFVITSEVVRDWRQYVHSLMQEINGLFRVYTLFSFFKIDDEVFDVDVFWLHKPSAANRTDIEKRIVDQLNCNQNFAGLDQYQVHHNIVADDDDEEDYRADELSLQTKSLFVETPKIGGIVGIGIQAEVVNDDIRLLVIESVLSTLLNVVGSVKAIYKYTRDLEQYATRDSLTGLYNQRVFWELLEYEVDRAERGGYPFTVMVVDLDNFKFINDTYGHSFGDAFLQGLSCEIRAVLRKGDVLARYGGDEFVIILSEERDNQYPHQAASRVLDTLSNYSLSTIDGDEVRATVSIGAAVYPQHADNAKDLFMFADNMMYKAKRDGKNRIAMPEESDVIDVFRRQGERNQMVLNAIEQRLFIPHFQPIVSLQDDQIYAHEVLGRLQLDPNTILGAGEFIEQAERMGVIHRLDYIIMEKALAQAQLNNYRDRLFINLSPRVLILDEFITVTEAMVERYDIQASQIVFEITERETVRNMALLESFVHELKQMGFQFAIDDFGSGFSSFHYLKRLPVDYLKIEGDFISNLHRDKKDHAFVNSMAKLAQDLGILTVAEYVENEEVLIQAREIGIDLVQGYYIGRPDSHFDLQSKPIQGAGRISGSVRT